jgi:hypothetical protein
MNIYKEFIIRSIKIINIGWATSAYFIMAILTLYILHKIYGDFDTEYYEKMPMLNLSIDFVSFVWVLGVLMYLARNIFPLIPFPFDGFLGYDHNKVKEVTSATAFSIFIVTFNSRLQGYYSIIKKKLFNF